MPLVWFFQPLDSDFRGCFVRMDMTLNMRSLDKALNIMIIFFHSIKIKKAKLKGQRALQPLMRDL